MATGGNHSKIFKGQSGEYLSKNDLLFIDDFMATGMQNAWQSYLRVFKDSSEKAAKSKAYNLLKRPRIREEIQYRLKASRATEAFIIESALEYVANGKKDFKASTAGQKSLEMLAKYKGMLDVNQTVHFTSDSPAVFPCPLSADEMKEAMERRQKMGRITE